MSNEKQDGAVFSFEGMYSLENMVKSAVIRARPRCYGKAPRWVAVRDAIGYGSTTSTKICRHFGIDPHEEIEGWPQPEANEPSALHEQGK